MKYDMVENGNGANEKARMVDTYLQYSGYAMEKSTEDSISHVMEYNIEDTSQIEMVDNFLEYGDLRMDKFIEDILSPYYGMEEDVDTPEVEDSSTQTSDFTFINCSGFTYHTHLKEEKQSEDNEVEDLFPSYDQENIPEGDFDLTKLEGSLLTNKDINCNEFAVSPRDEKHQCKHCYKAFSDENMLQNHVTTSHLHQRQNCKNNTQCKFCGKVLSHKHNLQKHINSVHLKIRLHSCEVCCKKFALKNDLRDHFQAVHEKVKACICDLCGIPLATMHGLRMHRLIHQENSKNINCDKCDKSFRHMSTLRKHISRVHEFKPENRLQCPHCDKLYNHNEGLQRHIKKFHGLVISNQFVCKLCTASFAYNYDLNKHMKRFHKTIDSPKEM